MLAREWRLRQPEDFEAVRQNGKTWSNEYLALSSLPNGRDQNRYGFVVSKRLGSAVLRNRVRRRLREVVRQRLSGHRPGYDIVLIARKPSASAEYAALEGAFASLEKHAGLTAKEYPWHAQR